MKFIVSSSALLKKLNSLNGVIPSNPVIPILENFLFDIKDKQLVITASDLQTFLRTSIDVEAHGTSKLAIPAKIILETLKNLPNQPITFTIDEDSYNIEITSNNGRYKLAGENANDFPEIPDIQQKANLTLPLETFRNAISKTIFASSTDELKPAIGGVYIVSEEKETTSEEGNQKEKQTTFVATDSHKLSKYIKHDCASSAPISVIVPKKPLNIISSLTSTSNSDSIEMLFGNSHISFSIENTKVVTRLVDEKYVEYENVVPEQSPYKLTAQKEELVSSLKRVAIYSNKSANQIRLKMTGSELQILTEDLDFSNEAVERLTCNYEGEDLEIGFNAKFLIEALNKISSEEVVLLLGSPQRAVKVIPKDKKLPEGVERSGEIGGVSTGVEELLMIVMPVIINDEVYI